MWKDGPGKGRRSMLRGSEKYMPLPLNASRIGMGLVLWTMENPQRFLSRGKEVRQLWKEQVKAKHDQDLANN